MNDGVLFSSDNYTAKFAMRKNNAYEIKTAKLIIRGRFWDAFARIPLLKGLYSLFDGSTVFAIVIMINLVMDSYRFVNRHNSSEIIVPTPIAIAFLSALAVVLIYLAKKTLFMIRRTWAFHGAEHKTIYAYDHDIELRLDDVRNCPRISNRCGTNIAIFLILFYLLFVLFVPYPSVRLILAYVLAYEVFDIKDGDMVPILKIFFIVGYRCQEKLFTAEPTDLQLAASIETLKKLIALEDAQKCNTEPS